MPDSDEVDGRITSSTWFVKRAKRNLLHLCAYLHAPSCVRLLVHPPYTWDPDQPDRTNQTPMHFAEARDDLATLFELIHLSREQRQPSLWPLRRPQLNGLASVCLFWPQQMLACPVSLRAILTENRTIGISGCQDNMSTQYVYRTLMIGPLLALLLDLYIATPELFEFDLWTGQEIPPANVSHSFENNRFWPIRTNELDAEAISHAGCTIYPHCLYQLSIQCRLLGRTLLDTLVQVRSRWLLHRCTTNVDSDESKDENGSTGFEQGSRSWSPFRLMDYCRAIVRRTLVSVHGLTMRQNYAQLVSRLHVPDPIHTQLLYRDIWDGGDFEPYLLDGHGGNVPLGVPLDAQHVRYDDGPGDIGLLIGHRFIPDRVSNSVGAS
ncbi:hypothetical protein FGIG_06558 [Fasciola gigantica]|uniref:SOCS box domain-containing protein n=1 Tax=Fasciola gigantica TaxID=46835 RepID=A0A504YQ50_FASGI|nr:hypothetical protein FGIG_06558 [Fasciola gigantica]